MVAAVKEMRKEMLGKGLVRKRRGGLSAFGGYPHEDEDISLNG